MSDYIISTKYLSKKGVEKVKRQLEKHSSELKRNNIRKARKQKQLQWNSF